MTVSVRTRVNEYHCHIRYWASIRQKHEIFLCSKMSPLARGRPNLLVSGCLCSLKVKCLVYEGGHSPSSSAEVKNVWAIPPFPLYAFMSCGGTNLPFIFTSNLSTCTKQRSYSKTQLLTFVIKCCSTTLTSWTVE